MLISLIDIEQSSNDAFRSAITVGETGYTEIVDGNGIVLCIWPGHYLSQAKEKDRLKHQAPEIVLD